MPASQPQTVAHYRILSKLGEGGMGEVWRAADTKLGRDVAIKVLPASYALDADRMARFVREAQVLAGLNHPNIAAIYGIEERSLILELVEGQTLADRIADGPVPLHEALPLIHQLIDALDYAHQKGVVHRDLKPANIKVTPEGKLKVLDFGLAKALADQPPATAEPANSPALTIGPATIAGVIMGTAAYMSPEQARGKPVDKRADIWAFGVVVYELLTGRQLFDGETTSDILAQTLTKPIDLAPIPDAVRSLLQRCLERDPQKRLRDLGDAATLLEAPTSRVVAEKRRPIPWIAATVVSLLAASTIGVLWQRAASTREPALSIRTALGNIRLNVSISPDGSTLLFETADGLQIRRIDELRPVLLPGTQAVLSVFWSGDSAAIGFFQNGKLRILPLATKEVRTLADAPEPLGATWRGSATGGDIVFVSAGKLRHLNLASGAIRVLDVPIPQDHRPLNPTFLPKGDRFVFTAGPADRLTRTLYLTSLKGETPSRLLDTPYRVSFARHPRTQAWYMFYSTAGSTGTVQANLIALPIDPTTGRKMGEPVQVLDGVGVNTRQHWVAADFSENGRMTFRPNLSSTPVFRIRWHDASGTVLTRLGDKLASNEIVLSPDESQVATITGFPAKGLQVMDARTGNSRRITRISDTLGQGIAWSPDSKFVYYQVEQANGTFAILRAAADASGRTDQIGVTDFPLSLMDISPDGLHLIFGPVRVTGAAFYVLRTDGPPNSAPKLWVSFPLEFLPRGAQGRFTKDGKYVFTSGGVNEGTFIPWDPERPVNAPVRGTLSLVLTGPFFSADGKRLCGVDSSDRPAMVCHSVTPVPGRPPQLGPPTVLFATVMPQLSVFGKVGAIAKDGRVLLLSTDEPEEIGTQFLSDWTLLLPPSQR